MMMFAKRRMNVTDWMKVQDRIGALQLSMGAPHDLMMLSAETGSVAQQEIYIGLPSEALLSDFPGFEKVSRSELPDRLSTLVVREDEFEKRFPDIYQKRRVRR
jgi:hypothetical protein